MKDSLVHIQIKGKEVLVIIGGLVGQTLLQDLLMGKEGTTLIVLQIIIAGFYYQQDLFMVSSDQRKEQGVSPPMTCS